MGTLAAVPVWAGLHICNWKSALLPLCSRFQVIFGGNLGWASGDLQPPKLHQKHLRQVIGALRRFYSWSICGIFVLFFRNCETQRFPDQKLSSSIFTCWLSVPHRWHLHLSPLYDVLDHTNQIFSVRIWSCQCVSNIQDKYKDTHKDKSKSKDRRKLPRRKFSSIGILDLGCITSV